MGNDPILTLSQSVVLNLYTMVTVDWHRWKESNPHSHFRRMLSYPLNDSGKMAPGVGIEPTIAESKSVVLPLHYPGSNKTGCFFTVLITSQMYKVC